jgi:hypothetical protein
MKEKIRTLQADIRKQLGKIQICKAELQTYVQREGSLKNPDNYQKATIGYYLHNFYNGCENIFSLIAKAFENNIESHQWHKSLLERMTLEIKDIRPQVIDDDLCQRLDMFRGFRHIFRNCYSFELDWKRQRLVFKEFNGACKSFNSAIDAFLKKIDLMID